ncbi:MAG TPA: translation initiation factor IF-2, partial [Lachnospiraceae bacterium]|nr:translation initiation factor IF-2 [Lachnospiraceae bacterium]
MRVHELAKKIDRTSKDVLTCLEQAGIMGKTASSSLEEAQIAVVRKKFPSAPPAGKEPVKAEEKPPEKEKPKAADALPKKKKSNIIFVSNPHNSQVQGRNNAGFGQRVVKGTPVRPGSQQSNAKPQKLPPRSSDAVQSSDRTPGSTQSLGGDQNKQIRTQSQENVKNNKTNVQRSGSSVRTGNYNNYDNQRNEGYRNQTERVRQPYQGNRDTQRQGQYQNRDGQNRGSYQNRDGQNRGSYQNRDGQGQNRGSYQNRDGQNRGPYQNRDGQNRGPYQNRDGQNRGPYQNRDGQNSRPGQPYAQGNRNFQNNRGNVNGGFSKDAKESVKEQEKHRDEQEKRRQNQDKRKKEQTYKNEDGFRGGRTAKGTKFTKLGRPQEKQVDIVKEEEKIKVIILPEVMTIRELADKMKIQPAVIVKKLFLQGKVVVVNQEITYEQAEEIAVEFDVLCEKEVVVDVIEELLKEDEEDQSEMTSRPPVICVMGHVDHGKTSLLDAIRKTHVIDKEAGGITQHIGAYVVDVNGRRITFLDTPGHEAFTAMRMRGANSTDIAILVVAADDGVMPQTIEAINHAKAAGIEIIVAVNKIDKPSANIDRVKQELSEYELVPEDWGGSTVYASVSAKTGEGIENLLEMILLSSDILELKANANRRARGLVIEAQLDKGRGPVATVLVQKGTLSVGDFIAAGSCHGKVRAMIDDKGKRVKEAGPSTPVEILGLNDVPNAGEIFVSPENDKEARNFAATFISQNKVKLLDDTKAKMSLDDLFTQ